VVLIQPSSYFHKNSCSDLLKHRKQEYKYREMRAGAGLWGGAPGRGSGAGLRVGALGWDSGSGLWVGAPGQDSGWGLWVRTLGRVWVVKLPSCCSVFSVDMFCCTDVCWCCCCVSAGSRVQPPSSHHVSAGRPVLGLDQVRLQGL